MSLRDQDLDRLEHYSSTLPHEQFQLVAMIRELHAELERVKEDLKRASNDLDSLRVGCAEIQSRAEKAERERDEARATNGKLTLDLQVANHELEMARDSVRLVEADNVALREGLERAIFLINPYKTDSAKLENLLQLAHSPNPEAGILAVYNAAIEWERDMRERGAIVTSWDVPLLRAVRALGDNLSGKGVIPVIDAQLQAAHPTNEETPASDSR